MTDDEVVTLQQAADRVGVTRSALTQRCLKGDLQRFRGNDGLWRVRLSDVAAVFPPKDTRVTPVRTDTRADSTNAEFLVQIGRLEERLSHRDREIDLLREESEQQRQQLEDLRADRDAWRAHALREETEQARADRDAWREEIEQARSDRDAWRAAALRPWWRRLLG